MASEWVALRNALADRMAEAGFPMDRVDTYTPETRHDPEDADPPDAATRMVLGFSGDAYDREPARPGSLDLDTETVSLTLRIFGSAPDEAAADAMTELTERLFRFLKPHDRYGRARPGLEIGHWHVADVQLAPLFAYTKMAHSNRRWIGVMKIRCER